MHTHFASATFGLCTFLTVLIFGTFWRIAMLHLARSRHPFLSKLAKAGLIQY